MANEVVINVKANTDKANRGLKGLGQSITTVARQAGIAATAVGVLGLVAIKSFVSAALEQQRALRTLGQTVENTGVRFDSVRDKILATTAALQDKTNFGDEEQIRTLTILTTILGDVNMAMEALPAVMDAASASGLGMESVAKTMGKALAGQVHQAESVGIIFDKTSGFGARLEQVLGKVGGAAEANSDPLQQLTADIGDLKESIGEALLPVLIPVVEHMRDWAKQLQTVNPEVITLLTRILALVTAFGLIAGPIMLAVAGLGAMAVALSAIFSLTGLLVVAVVAFGVAWHNQWLGVRDFTNQLLREIEHEINDFLRGFRNSINAMIEVYNFLARTFKKFDEIDLVPEWTFEFKALGKVIKGVTVDLKDLAKEWLLMDQTLSDPRSRLRMDPRAGMATGQDAGGGGLTAAERQANADAWSGSQGVSEGGTAAWYNPNRRGGGMPGGDDSSAVQRGLDFLGTQNAMLTGGGAGFSQDTLIQGWKHINMGFQIDTSGNVIIEYIGQVLRDDEGLDVN